MEQISPNTIVEQLIDAGMLAKIVYVSKYRPMITIRSDHNQEFYLKFEGNGNKTIYMEYCGAHYTRRSTTGVGTFGFTPIDEIVGYINGKILFYKDHPYAT